ncbi:hypothetical protein AQUCO_03800124v1 [Aquilegia coerulea]|uniref:Uncharacterized protein n=1 Tax=Aquilegia coerulea TaxID=218851 RepID=A0A2G5CSP5_AQUCA|nr:hypothetical protein AQUCO_03800124v1 [Aquilegia coerulea]
MNVSILDLFVMQMILPCLVFHCILYSDSLICKCKYSTDDEVYCPCFPNYINLHGSPFSDFSLWSHSLLLCPRLILVPGP